MDQALKTHTGASVQDASEFIDSLILTAPGHIMELATSRKQHRDRLTSRGEQNIDEISAKSKESRC